MFFASPSAPDESTMEKWINNLLVDASPPEKRKFKSPLVFVHGLWSGSWCWQPWSTHFANFGWECWAVNLRGRFGERAIETLRQLTFQQCVEDLKRVIREAPFPPVVLGHSFGGLIAQKVAEEEKLSALILLSSLLPGGDPMASTRALRLLRLKYLPLIWLRQTFCPDERDFSRSWLASLPERQRSDISRQMVPESSHLVSELFRRRVEIDPGHFSGPVLVVGGSADRVVPVTALKALANRLGADFQHYPEHGHWILQEEGSEKVVRDIHRWLMQRLGEAIWLAESPDRG
ncbi:MAG: hypothetical protein A2038_10640 [Deltaproteobacteria bacterium GWA2_57_13]|nr:MAG: hypothetical protein A2038_10640 [Deltaproteobacteria bacterium GWA2_57_13]